MRIRCLGKLMKETVCTTQDRSSHLIAKEIMLKSSILMDFESSISNIYKKLLESLYFYFVFYYTIYTDEHQIYINIAIFPLHLQEILLKSIMHKKTDSSNNVESYTMMAFKYSYSYSPAT